MAKEIIIDAKNKSLGRTATEVARNLMAKTSAGYLPHVAPKIRVKVINLSGAKINEKKLEQKTYKRYSGYPGNLKYVSLEKIMEKSPKIAFKKMVSGMLPKNKLKKQILKNLVVEI
jgi:large subunit ribosomal protein L13